jgi:hypothetical protein
MSEALLERSSSDQSRNDCATANISDNVRSYPQRDRSGLVGETSFPLTKNDRRRAEYDIRIGGSCHDRHDAFLRRCATRLFSTELGCPRLGIVCRAPLTSKYFCREVSRKANIRRQNQPGSFKLKTGLDRALKLTGPDCQ